MKFDTQRVFEGNGFEILGRIGGGGIDGGIDVGNFREISVRVPDSRVGRQLQMILQQDNNLFLMNDLMKNGSTIMTDSSIKIKT